MFLLFIEAAFLDTVVYAMETQQSLSQTNFEVLYTQPSLLFPSVCSVTRADYLNTFEFLEKLAENLKMKLSSQPKL